MWFPLFLESREHGRKAMQVRATNTIADVVEILTDIDETVLEPVAVYLCGERLQHERTLSDYNIVPGMTLHFSAATPPQPIVDPPEPQSVIMDDNVMRLFVMYEDRMYMIQCFADDEILALLRQCQSFVGTRCSNMALWDMLGTELDPAHTVAQCSISDEDILVVRRGPG
jgi:hypothetical protein